MKPNTTTLAIKARVANKFRAILYKKKLDMISEVDKILLFDNFFKEIRTMHDEIVMYKYKRKLKRIVAQLRVKRGYTTKKKMNKREYQQSIMKKQVA